MPEARISILLPYRNTARFLGDCLDSVQKQGFRDWELLAVNDHSSDGSGEILRSYAKRDVRIRPLNNAGHGIIPALRMAFERSRGHLITRMDSDDLMADGRLETMAGQLQAAGTGHIAMGQVRYFSKKGIASGYRKYERWLNGLIRKGTNYSEIYKECVIPSPCWMVYRSDLLRAGAFDPDRYPEDYDLCFRFYRQNLRCLPSDTLLHYWRDHKERASRNSRHYADNHFLEIKLHYFLKLDRVACRPLVLWGAGKKGKTLCKLLTAQGIDFIWVCNNPRKIGKEIYGRVLRSFRVVEQVQDPQCVVAVARPSSQLRIREFLKDKGYRQGLDYFFFC